MNAAQRRRLLISIEQTKKDIEEVQAKNLSHGECTWEMGMHCAILLSEISDILPRQEREALQALLTLRRHVLYGIVSSVSISDETKESGLSLH